MWKIRVLFSCLFSWSFERDSKLKKQNKKNQNKPEHTTHTPSQCDSLTCCELPNEWPVPFFWQKYMAYLGPWFAELLCNLCLLNVVWKVLLLHMGQPSVGQSALRLAGSSVWGRRATCFSRVVGTLHMMDLLRMASKNSIEVPAQWISFQTYFFPIALLKFQTDVLLC